MQRIGEDGSGKLDYQPGAHGWDVVTHCHSVIEIDAERQRRLEAMKSWTK